MTYIDSSPQVRRWGEISEGHLWGAHTFDRLAWQYGPERAQQIRAGRDQQTNEDLAAWRRLGERA